MVAEVERSADLLCNICKAARRIYGHELDPKLRGIISRMGEQAQQLYDAAIESFVENDAAKAAAIDDMDNYLDGLQKQFIQAIFESHAAGRIDLQVAVQLAVVARFYERIGDHAVNIGEQVRFVVTGWMPEHKGAERYRQHVDATGEIPRVAVAVRCLTTATERGDQWDFSNADEPTNGRRDVDAMADLASARACIVQPSSTSTGRARRSTTCRSAWCWSTPRGAEVLRNAAVTSRARATARCWCRRPSTGTCSWRCAVASPRLVGRAVRSAAAGHPGDRDAVARRRRGGGDRRHQRAGPPRRGAHRLRGQHQPRAEDAGRRAGGAGRGDRRRGRHRGGAAPGGQAWSTRRTVRRTAIDDLLELSRIELGGRAVRDPVAVAQLMRDAVVRTLAAAEQRDIRIDLDEPDEQLTVLGDRRQLLSALANLIDNAVKYSEPGNDVRVSAQVDASDRTRRWSCSAWPTPASASPPATSIASSNGSTGSTGPAAGTPAAPGLGLAIVRHVATNHEGEVQVQSSEGEGSTFTLRIPVGAP